MPRGWGKWTMTLVSPLDELAPVPEFTIESARRLWTQAEAGALYEAPFSDLLFRAHCIHRENFAPNRVQLSRLLSIKSGGCPEDCGYCSQSAHHATGLKASKLMAVERVSPKRGGARRRRDALLHGRSLAEPEGARHGRAGRDDRGREGAGHGNLHDARHARSRAGAAPEAGGPRLLQPQHRHLGALLRRDHHDAQLCRSARHLDMSAQAGIKVCCGGIVGMGETRGDRVDMLVTLANLAEPPRERADQYARCRSRARRWPRQRPIEPIEFVRIIALARILMPKSDVRLSAGRTAMSDEMQALCFFAGANSIFVGDTLLTTGQSRGRQRQAPVPPARHRADGSCPRERARLARPLRDDLRGLARKDRLRALSPRAGLDFASNDYLGLAGSPRLRQAVAAALARGTPVGAAGSRLLRGNAPEHEELEGGGGRLFRGRTGAVLRRRLLSPISPC